MLRKTWRIIKFIILLILIVCAINIYVVASTFLQVKDQENLTANNVTDYYESGLKPQCAMVLGASINVDETPSPVLKERLDTAISLYHEGIVPKLLLSGDNGQVEYDEVTAMKKYVISKGVKPNDIFLDYAGFSTYESVYRADYIFKVKRMIVVTQKYHMYRALYGCKRMGIEAIGVAADKSSLKSSITQNGREILARTKDLIKWIIKPEPTFLGSPIPITEKGMVTDETPQ